MRRKGTRCERKNVAVRETLRAVRQRLCCCLASAVKQNARVRDASNRAPRSSTRGAAVRGARQPCYHLHHGPGVLDFGRRASCGGIGKACAARAAQETKHARGSTRDGGNARGVGVKTKGNIGSRSGSGSKRTERCGRRRPSSRACCTVCCHRNLSGNRAGTVRGGVDVEVVRRCCARSYVGHDLRRVSSFVHANFRVHCCKSGFRSSSAHIVAIKSHYHVRRDAVLLTSA
jgi:hypothetical protein